MVGGPETAGPRAILAIEGALRPAGAALIVGDRLVAVERVPPGRGTRSDLFAASRRALGTAGVAPSQLACVAVGVGPGSYTGVRVALALTRGLVLAARRRPSVLWADSLAILARAAGRRPAALVAIRWGRHRVLVARAADGGPGAGGARLVPVNDLTRLRGLAGEAIVVDEGAAELTWPETTRLERAEMPPVEALANLALEDRLAESVGEVPEPAYLVAPDAVLPARGGSLPAGFELVTLTVDALDETERIERLSFGDPWSREMLRGELETRGDRVAFGVIAPDARLAAVTLVRLGEDALSVFSIAVDPEHRRRGLARALLRRVVEEGRRLGIPRADLEVRETDRGAVALYRSEGFVPTGRRRRYYADGGDALLMSLVIRRESA